MNDQQVQSEQPEEQKEQNQSEKPIILLVEDDPVLSRMYSQKFKTEGLRVLAAKDGEEGLRIALEQKIDIILLDLMLPRMSGNDLLERLRQDSKGKDIPVVTLTNLADPQEKDRSLRLGVKEYLVKAMQTPEDVVQTIRRQLGIKS
jgi:CheY-like chemotaxis protein